MSMLKWVLKAAVPIPKLESYQRFLFVGPHPDDIEIGAGATEASSRRAVPMQSPSPCI